jgi:hypothetical protein
MKRPPPVDIEPGRTSPWRATGRYLLFGLPMGAVLVLVAALLPDAGAGQRTLPRAVLAAAAVALVAFPFAAFASSRPPEEGAWGGTWLRGSALPLRLWGGGLSAFAPPLVLYLLQRPLLARWIEDVGRALGPNAHLGVTAVFALAILMLVAQSLRWPLSVVFWPPLLSAVLTTVGWSLYQAQAAGVAERGGWFAMVALLLVTAFGLAALAARTLPLGKPPKDSRPRPPIGGEGKAG